MFLKNISGLGLRRSVWGSSSSRLVLIVIDKLSNDLQRIKKIKKYSLKK
jgi:hypothetical protein